MKKREHDLAAKLHCYASGSGALSFVWVSTMLADRGNATPDKVTLDDVAAFLKENKQYSTMDAIELWGEYHLIEKIEQIHPTEIKIGDDSFSIEGDLLVKYYPDGDRIIVRNYSILASFKFWKENQGNWTTL